MNRQIYTYTDLQELDCASFWEKIKKYPQITVTADLRKSVKGNVQAVEFRRLCDTALPNWTSEETKFRELVVLSEYLRKQLAMYGDDPDVRHWLVGCRRNKGLLLSSMILLEEAGISPEDMRAEGDRNMQLLLDAWKYVKEKDSAIRHFHEHLSKLESRRGWNLVFNRIFGKTDFDTLVFHGFYYFTPLQERLMRLLEKAGIRLIFLFSYDEKYPYANEIWTQTYSEENGYPPQSLWNMEKRAETEPIGEIFEGRKAVLKNRVTIKEYASVIEFVHGVKRAKEEGYFLYTANPATANGLLRDFYPEEYGERKLLSYPIGQFVSILNKLWDEEKQEVVLEEDSLMELFSSGWLAIDGDAGRNHMEDLERILPFFKDCRAVKEWRERIELLEEIEEKVIKPFDAEGRWEKVMGNPFLNFSVFSVVEEDLKVILQLIRQVLNMAEELFGEQGQISIQEHIGKLNRILKQYELSNELYEEEFELVKSIFEKLNESSDFSARFYPGDISAALNLYMNGSLQETEVQADKGVMAAPLYQIDCASIRAKGKVHICLCDVENLPGGKKEYVWPLTGRHIQEYYARTGNPLIKNMRHVMECSYICNRYMLYTGLKNQDVQLSWISSMGDKMQAPSPYIRLICEAAGKKVIPAARKRITYEKAAAQEPQKSRTFSYEIEKMPENTGKEAKMDYAVCPMKYAFGYVLEPFPVYSNEFQQSYAINGLIAALYGLLKTKGYSVDEIYNQVMALFPAMRKVEKRQILDYFQYESSFQDEEYEGISELNQILYTEERLKVRFPNKNIRNQALEGYGKLMTPEGKRGMDFYRTAADLNTDPYKKVNLDVCLFCQHQNHCRYAVFAADQEALYD